MNVRAGVSCTKVDPNVVVVNITWCITKDDACTVHSRSKFMFQLHEGRIVMRCTCVNRSGRFFTSQI